MTETGPPLPLLSRYAIMVDVGYIYASAGELLFSAASRREYRVDADKLIQALTRHAEDHVRGELLRVYWYDAARDRVPTIDQRVIAQMPWVKLRLGNLNARGQQKGVDAQIRADMEALARHRAITDAILVAGDEDMVPAVEAAQAFGVRVHLWGVEPPYGTNQAERLVWESDTVDVLERSFVEPFFTRQLAPEPAQPRRAEPARPESGHAGAGPEPCRAPVASPGVRRAALEPAVLQAVRRSRTCRPPGSARTGSGSRKPASTSRRSGYSRAARTTSATCCRARSCRRSSTRSCSSTPRRSSACRCAPIRKPGNGCAMRSGLECIASSASVSASRRAEFMSQGPPGPPPSRDPGRC